MKFRILPGVIGVLFFAVALPIYSQNKSRPLNRSSSPSLLDPPAPSGTIDATIAPLDSMPVQAVENYRNPHKSQFSFGVGYYPLNAYYTGYAPGIAYTLFYSRSYAWDVIDASYVFAVDKGLTSELADKYKVEPKTIDRLKYTAFTQIAYFFSYGKTVLASSYIRYFRSALLLGGGVAGQSLSTRLGVSYGLRLEAYATDSFSLKAEIKNITTVTNGVQNHAALILGSTLSF